MRVPDFTGEQQAAIERREGGLLLTANAGSGKTWVMVERYVRSVLDDGVEPGRILAITFTEKAAAQLRGRIVGRFRDLDDEPHARAAEGASISTIHGLCARLLRADALTAGLDPAFTVLDEAEADRLARVTFAAALDELVEAQGEVVVELVAAYGAGPLREAIVAVHDELRGRGERAPALPPAPTVAPVEPARQALAQARVVAARELADAGASGANARKALDCLQGAEVMLEPGERVSAPGTLRSLELPGGNGKALASGACSAYREALEAYRQACADHHALGQHRLLDLLLRGFGTRYAAAKRARSALDFSDLELEAGRLLQEHPAVRARNAERFVRVMVDEFQDTNPLQVALLGRIAGEDLFTVGDEHQSIYGFRNADVTLFRKRRQALAQADATAELATSFRAHRELLDALNLAFAPRFGESFVPLVAKCRDGDPVPVQPPVELLVVDRDADWDAAGLVPEGAVPRAPAWRLAEARLLAGRVRELLDTGHAAGDVVVLLRATGDLGAFEDALEARGIPTYVIGGRGYWSRREVTDLVAHLAVLANPRDGLALYQVLGSPLVGASSDALVHLAASARAAGRDPWWTLRAALQDGDDPGGLVAALAAEDRERLASFVTATVRERAQAPRRPLEALIDRALRRTGYDLVLLRAPGGPRRLANVRKLMRLAREYEAAEGRDLRGFVDTVSERGVDDIAEARESEAPVEGETLDAVRLMTIHRAKGLEFDVVCVADLGRRSPASGRDLLRVSSDGRVGIKLSMLEGDGRHPALDYPVIGEARSRAEAAEEERLFYVAMTRAKKRLVLSGAIACATWPEVKFGGPPLAWIGPAFVPGLAQRLAAGESGGTAERDDQGWRARVRWSRHVPEEGEVSTSVAAAPGAAPVPSAEPSAGEAQLQLDLSAAPAAAPNPAPPLPARARRETVAQLSYSGLEEHRRCGYRFYLERMLRLPPAPAVEGVLAIADGGLATADGESCPAPSETALPAAARGTIVHDLLERLDLQRARRPSAEQIAQAAGRAEAQPTAAEAEEIAATMQRFIDSPLRARLAAARDLRREERFAFLLEDPDDSEDAVVVTGAIDALAYEGERALVVDYKTDRLADDDSPEQAVARGYATQRLVYALALLRAGAPEVEVVHCFLARPDELASARYAVSDVPRLEVELTALAQSLRHSDYPVSPTPNRELCAGCPGRGTLCSWPEEQTRAELAAP